MRDEYIQALKAGEKEYRRRIANGEYPYVDALDDILPDNITMPHKDLGLMEIPTALIGGTKTRARQNSFTPDFMPLLEEGTEFSAKWSNLYQAQLDEGFTSPIRVYEYLHRFYVLEGNKRVSVSRFLGMPTIMADVTRIIPSRETLNEHPEYEEFLEFYRVCPIYDIECSMPGAYSEIAELLGQDIRSQEKWPEDAVKSLQSSYWRFSEVFGALRDKLTDMPAGDAFLVYLRIYAPGDRGNASGKVMDKRLRRIRHELRAASNDEKVSLVESPDDTLKADGIINKAGNVIGKMLPSTYNSRHPLKAAFIYDRGPEESNWMYNHEAGRRRLEQAYGGIVKTARFIACGGDADPCSDAADEIIPIRDNAGRPASRIEMDGESFASCEKAIAAAVAWGADVVFTTSVKQMTDTLRAAIEYEDVIFMNCSINLAHQAVRTYYAKLYEAKFLAGLVAGSAAASDGSHRIGYCSDYPIYGTIAGINAFAIGAAMADPSVKIYLEWSSRVDNNWWWSMVDKGIHVISAIDSTHNTDGSNAYGVCYVEKVEPGTGTDLSKMCKVTNLAAPIWKWGKLYEIIIKSVLEGTYHTSLADKKDQATNYWWGMISGVVDIELSDDLPRYTRQLVEILRSDIISGSMNPFDGELRSQDGWIRRDNDPPLTSKDIITMDWLNENIIGEIPEKWMLTHDAQETVKVSGVREKR